MDYCLFVFRLNGKPMGPGDEGKAPTVNMETEVLVLSVRSWPGMGPGPRKEYLWDPALGNQWSKNIFDHSLCGTVD